jgi:hypothetical protein
MFQSSRWFAQTWETIVFCSKDTRTMINLFFWEVNLDSHPHIFIWIDATNPQLGISVAEVFDFQLKVMYSYRGNLLLALKMILFLVEHSQVRWYLELHLLESLHECLIYSLELHLIGVNGFSLSTIRFQIFGLGINLLIVWKSSSFFHNFLLDCVI